LCTCASNLIGFVPSAIGCPEVTCNEDEEIFDIYNTMGIVL
jgi:hypothetical protein